MDSTALNLRNHIMLTSSKEVTQLCEPLSTQFRTTYFNFVRRHEDGSEICLTSDANWTEYFYTNKLYKSVLADKFAKTKMLVNRLKIIPWAHFVNSPVRIAQSQFSGVGIGLSLIFTRNGHTDFFHYGTQNENREMIELYLSYADCLVQFAYYFYDKGNKLISVASRPENRIMLSDRPMFRIDQEFPDLPEFDVPNFVNETKPKHFIIYSRKSGEVLLSKKEIMCINLLTRGKTASEIGEILYTSKRTVETHLKNARQKLGLPSGASRSDLITELYNSGFDFHDLLPH